MKSGLLYLLLALVFISACDDSSTGSNDDLSDILEIAEPSCTDGLQNGDESDIDCGGECQACEVGLACERDADCLSGVCDELCLDASCEDDVLNGSESDVDCGGEDCGPCEVEQSCNESSDCRSGVCESEQCLEASCADGVINGAESDVDCGGDQCEPCQSDKACGEASDCISQVCEDDHCQAPTCDDEVANGEESDVDCGGKDCDPCELGASCTEDSDCDSGVCDEEAELCIEATCEDGELNGRETDVDCGGGCLPCAEASSCLFDDDCSSLVCLNTAEGRACQAPSCDDNVLNGDETALDCGGSCAPCALGKACLTAADCQSGACTESLTCGCPEGWTEDIFGGCDDIDECATNNGGCGDPSFYQCTNQPGGAPLCMDIDECAAFNGGCGNSLYWICSNNEGAAPTCIDIDECAVDNGGCGDSRYFSCNNTIGGPAHCADIDECAIANGGCGDPSHWQCINNYGALPSCMDVDECEAGNHLCDPLALCTNTEGSYECTCLGGSFDIYGDGTECAHPGSCYEAAQAATVPIPSGDYTIETSAGLVDVYCDMSSDGGVGYTMTRIDDATNLLGDQSLYEQACADLGMEVIVPRTRAHALAIADWNGEFPNLINVFPDTNYAVGLQNWSGRCQGEPCSFWISNDNNANCAGYEPSSDNTTDYRIYRGGSLCDYGQWNDAYNAVGHQGWVLCSPNDTPDIIAASCHELALQNSVVNTDNHGVNGNYFIDRGLGELIEVYCDMKIDSGTGHTLKRIDDAALESNQQAYIDACEALGLELVVPRSRSHAQVIADWNGGIPNLVGVYPDIDNAAGLNNWSGRCDGEACDYWLSNTNLSDCTNSAPLGNNTTAQALHSLSGSDAECDYGRWVDGGDSVESQGFVICSTNDGDPAPSGSCLQNLANRLIFNKEDGINGVYSLDLEGDGNTTPVYCDMRNGGWGLAANLSQDDTFGGIWGSESEGTPSLSSKYVFAFDSYPKSAVRISYLDSSVSRRLSASDWEEQSAGTGRRLQLEDIGYGTEYLILSESNDIGGLFGFHNGATGYTMSGAGDQIAGTGIFNLEAALADCGDSAAWKPLPGSDLTGLVCGEATTGFVPGFFSLWFMEVPYFDFENDTLTPFSTHGNANWSTTSISIDGLYSAQSGAIADGQESNLELAVLCLEGGEIRFDYQVSSESSYDLLYFSIDGSRQGSWSGQILSNASYTLGEGSHTLIWSYDKDNSVSELNDLARIDNVELINCTIQ